MRYNRATIRDLDEERRFDALIEPIRAELRRRDEGPICAQCGFSPLDENDLPPLTPTDSRPSAKEAFVRTFFCEARGRQCTADGGLGCSSFARK